MSMHGTTIQLLKMLGAHAEAIADAYGVSRSEINANKVPQSVIDELERHRLVVFAGEDHQPRLSPRLVGFLDYALHTERLRQVDFSVADSLMELRTLSQQYLKVRLTSPEDAQQFLDGIHEAADSLCDSLNEVSRHLWRIIRSEFSVVTSIEAKRELNQSHLNKTGRLLDALKAIDLSELNAMGADDRALRRLFGTRLPRAMEESRQNLADALWQLTEMLFKFQRLEKRTGLVKGLIRHLKKHPNFQPSNYDEQLTVPDLFTAVQPLKMPGAIDISTDSSQFQLELIALVDGLRKEAPVGNAPAISDGLIISEQEPVVEVARSALKVAIRGIFLDVLEKNDKVSGMASFSPLVCDDPEIWLFAILSEHSSLPKKEQALFEITFDGAEDSFFTGNFKAKDVLVCPR